MRGWLSKCAVAVIAIALLGLGNQPASADDQDGSSGDQPQGKYLALGDSVPFGFNPLVSLNAVNYTGYPEVAARAMDLGLTNASCPGQTSGGFISLTGTDNGCFAFRQIPGSMHTAYDSSQLDYAVSFLRSNPKTRLVTVTLGSNDLILCADNSTDRCASQLSQVLANYGMNLTQIVQTIRTVYTGKIVAVNYYSPDYRDSVTTGALMALNNVELQVVSKFHGRAADAFTAFATAAARYGGDTCAAGLLIRLPSGGCDDHPSPQGARLLAATLTATLDSEDGD